MSTNKLDLSGKIFGNLIVIRKSTNKYRSNILWICKCALCSNVVEYRTSQLIDNHVTSCGCIRNAILKKHAFKKKLPPEIAAFNCLLKSYKQGANRRNLVFELTAEEVMKITKLSCFYCGTPPAQEYKTVGTNGTYTYNGIDRLDNDLGYIYGNCRPCCGACNRLKYKFTENDFISHVRRIYNYQLYKEGI